MMLEFILKGILISSSMIIAIGSQNVFVLKQGLLKTHIFSIVLICSLGDLFLMSIGILGFGEFINKSPFFTQVMTILGAIFLIYYGSYAFFNAYKGQNALVLDNNSSQNNYKKVILTTLAMIFLNPHVYLDTVVIMGSISATFTFDQKIYFLIGTVFASFMWFFALGYGSRFLIPLFRKQFTWRVLDIFIGIVMYGIAINLILYIN